MEPEQRQELLSSLQQHGRYDYVLSRRHGVRIYLNVNQDERGRWWARWCNEQNINDLEYFERIRRKVFGTRDEAIRWLHADYRDAWEDQGQTIQIRGPLRPER